MKCPWCGKNQAGQNGEGYCDVEGKYAWKSWYCEWRPGTGCGMIWNYGEDGSGHITRVETETRKAIDKELDGEMVVHGGVEV